MSQLNDDRIVLQDGRKNTLDSDAVAPLRDQIPTKLLAKCRELGIGKIVDQAWRIGNANRTNWLERQQIYMSDWDEFLESSAEGPFPGSSNLHLPLPLIVAKALHARFLQALLGIDPYFNVKSRTEANVDRAPLIQELMSYALKDWCNYRNGIDMMVDRWIWDWLTVGTAISKARWDVKYHRFVDVQKVMQAGAPKHVVDLKGQEQIVATQEEVEQEVTVTKKTFDGPVIEDLRHEDYISIGGDGDPQLADIVIHRQFLTASELWTLADREIFEEEAVREVIDGGFDDLAGAVASSVKYQRAHEAGKAAVRTSVELDRYEILEAYLSKDVDGSGINSEIVVWVHVRTGAILRATYLHRINSAGERPFFRADYHRRAGQEMGVGIIEMMHPICKEMDAMHNLRIDFGLISTMPFGFYRATSSINPEQIQLEPGMLIPCDDPQRDIYFPQLGNRTSFGMQEEQGLQTLLERLTGINDMSMGVLTGAQGATRTATGARALLGESNSNLDVHLRRLNLGWKQLLEYLLHMMQQRVPNGFGFRITGDDGNDYWRYIKDQKELEGDYDFEISPNSANSNMSIQQQTAQETLQLISNPFYVQAGAVNVTNIYEGLKALLKAKGIKDYGRYITKPAGYSYMPTPLEEGDRLLRGIDVPVQPNGDHQGFIDWWEYMKKHDELLGQFNEQQTVTLEKQSRKHQDMLNSLQQQKAQSANLQQMQMNAQNGVQQTQPGGGINILGKANVDPQVGGGASPLAGT